MQSLQVTRGKHLFPAYHHALYGGHKCAIPMLRVSSSHGGAMAVSVNLAEAQTSMHAIQCTALLVVVAEGHKRRHSRLAHIAGSKVPAWILRLSWLWGLKVGPGEASYSTMGPMLHFTHELVLEAQDIRSRTPSLEKILGPAGVGSPASRSSGRMRCIRD